MRTKKKVFGKKYLFAPLVQNYIQTSMHSNRIRTDRLSSGEVGGASTGGGLHIMEGSCTSLFTVNRMTHVCENITFPILRMRSVMNPKLGEILTGQIFTMKFHLTFTAVSKYQRQLTKCP